MLTIIQNLLLEIVFVGTKTNYKQITHNIITHIISTYNSKLNLYIKSLFRLEAVLAHKKYFISVINVCLFKYFSIELKY